ncbi:hypothetical protein SAMN05444172_3113 [Burkholderia sp. GAS332]|uniref:hypothetical protein n=2 Tax=Burkholderiaceae TaxID=119060 RepID=UPI0009289D5C|nr:hypothetical protein SAMN05444172_3113 [Burkholderia sp. GAS332]
MRRNQRTSPQRNVQRQIRQSDIDSRKSSFGRNAGTATLKCHASAWSTNMSKPRWDYSQHATATAPHDAAPSERTHSSHGGLVVVLLIAALCACFEREIAGPSEGAIRPIVAKYWQTAKAVIASPTH